MIQGVGDGFRSLRGLSCWCASAESQLSLATTLKTLNDRLEQARGTIDSKGVVTILGGLRGIDYPKLIEPALSEVARSLNLVNARLKKTTEPLNYQAIGTAIHSLGYACDVRQGPIQTATSRLLETIASKLPELPPATFGDVGMACSALYSLHPTGKAFSQLVTKLWNRVNTTPYDSIEIPYNDKHKVTSLSVIQQTFSIYGQKIPSALGKTLSFVQNSIGRHTSQGPSAGELRTREVLSCVPGLALMPTTTLAGFELDIPGRATGNTRLIDFEVDGPHHDEPCQRRSDGIRDRFFHKNGVETIRIPNAMSDESIVAALAQAGFAVDLERLETLRAHPEPAR